MSQAQSVMKNLLLSSLLATSLVAPLAAHAETVSVMVVNVRSDDGIYRPALRVLRGGTVTFFRTDDTEAENPLTVRTIYNQAALMAWLMEAIPATAGETFDIQIEQPPQSEPAEEKKPIDSECGPSPSGPSLDPEDDFNPCVPCGCSFILRSNYSSELPQVSVAEMTLEQRMQTYATV